MGPCEVWRRRVSWQSNVCEIQEVEVPCLQMTYGICEPQKFQCEEDAIFYKHVLRTNE